MTISQAKAALFGKIAYELFEEELLKSVERHINEFEQNKHPDVTKHPTGKCPVCGNRLAYKSTVSTGGIEESLYCPCGYTISNVKPYPISGGTGT